MAHIVFAKLAAANPWISSRLAFLVRHGSHAYGTNTIDSDEDFRGVAIAPKEFYLGFSNKFEQQELKEPDTCVFDIKKFFALAAACNPNTIEVLFTQPEEHLLINSIGAKIFDARDKFLSKRVRYTFAGYAKAQLNRIETHRKWLLNPIVKMPLREDFGLKAKPIIPEEQLLAAKAEIRKELEKHNFDFLNDLREDQIIAIQNTMRDIFAEIKITKEDEWLCAARKIGFDDNFIFYMQKEKEYENKAREWKQYNIWKAERNEKRAIFEAKYGYDCKYAYHLIRLLRMCKEILETGKVIVKRPDREELLAIRNGAWSYEKLIDYTKSEEAKLDDICARSKIAARPDIKFLDDLCVGSIEEMS
jgi:uncharacterized protein